MGKTWAEVLRRAADRATDADGRALRWLATLVERVTPDVEDAVRWARGGREGDGMRLVDASRVLYTISHAPAEVVPVATECHIDDYAGMAWCRAHNVLYDPSQHICPPCAEVVPRPVGPPNRRIVEGLQPATPEVNDA